jgi:tRNA A-37 threonylcarbamoyl transferase component Bud32
VLKKESPKKINSIFEFFFKKWDNIYFQKLGETGMTKLPQIPGYQVIEKLGQGGMADVYLGIQEKLQRQVAIKVMIPLLFRDEQFSKRFIKEAQTAAQLNHPNIITIHDVGETRDSYYIVMEYLEESLSQRLKQRGFLPPLEALEVVKMIACALDYAHKKGFIHRDIKPDNIMFRADGTVVLVDFGIARAMDSTTHLTRTGMSIGTPHYMSPEQCKGEKIDGRSDIYSLGVQFYEILTGKVPYNAENTAGIIIKHIQEPIPRLPDRLSRYQPLVDKMMAKERDKRFQDGEELIQFIDGFLTTRELVTPPKSRPETPTVTLEEPTMQTPVTPGAGYSIVRQEKKKWRIPAIIAAVIILAAVLLYFIIQKPWDQPGPSLRQTEETPEKEQPLEQSTTDKEKHPGEAGTETETKEDTKDTETSLDPQKGTDQSMKDAGKKEISPLKEEQKPGEKKNAAWEKEPEKKYDPDLKQTWKQEKTEPLKVEKKEEKSIPVKKEVKPPEVKTVNLLGLSPAIRQEYMRKAQRIAIPIPVRIVLLQVHGQITLNLFINEKGKVTVSSFNEQLTVVPARRKSNVINLIKFRINNFSLTPPRDKDGNPVRFNWRVTFKVGKLVSMIHLTKQQI